MMLPTKLRSNIIKINSKEVKISPWTNLTLIEFENVYSVNKDNFEQIEEYLITPFVESKISLTLQEKRYILIELYKLSKSSYLDIKFTCKECKEESNYTLDLNNCITSKTLKTRKIKTKDYIFNLKPYSTYLIDYKSKELHKETLRYIASFIKSIEDSENEYQIPSLDELETWLNTELDSVNFTELCQGFEKNQPDINISATAICEFCSSSNVLKFKGIEHFLKF